MCEPLPISVEGTSPSEALLLSIALILLMSFTIRSSLPFVMLVSFHISHLRNMNLVSSNRYDEFVGVGMDPDDAYDLTGVLNELKPERERMRFPVYRNGGPGQKVLDAKQTAKENASAQAGGCKG